MKPDDEFWVRLGVKLGIKPGHTVWVIGGPAELVEALSTRAPANYVSEAPSQAEVVLLFATKFGPITTHFPEAQAALTSAGGLWVCWPKRASGLATELNEDLIREYGLSQGLVDNKVCAVDETWSGLRFVIRLRDRV